MIKHPLAPLAKVVVVCAVAALAYVPLPKVETVPSAEAVFCSNCYTSVQGAIAWMEQNINAVQSTISAAADTVTSQGIASLEVKEYVLDGILFNIAQVALQQMTSSIVDWINSGFEGSPAFVQDLNGFLLDVGDEAAGNFIENELGAGVLCSPFQLDVQVALTVNVRQRGLNDEIPACTLSGVVDNIEGFLAGNFQEGGWEGWIEMTSQPQNTPYGAYLAAEAELNDVILKSQNEELKLLEFGDGFFSKSVCELIEGPNVPTEECFVSTPGQIIEEQLTFKLQSGERKLIEADEFNEIIGALFSQIGQQAITGVNGLLGLSGGSSYSDYSYGGGGYSYTEALAAEQPFTQIEDSQNPLVNALTIERELLAFYQGVLADVARAEAENLEAKETSDAADEALGLSACYDLSIDDPVRVSDPGSPNFTSTVRLNTFEAEALSEVPYSLTVVTILEDLIARYESADSTVATLNGDDDPTNDTTVAAVQYDIFLEYQRLLQQGSIRTEVDSTRLRLQLEPDFEAALAAFYDAIDAEATRCEDRRDESSSSRGSVGSER